jgi:hypothetical protein
MSKKLKTLSRVESEILSLVEASQYPNRRNYILYHMNDTYDYMSLPMHTSTFMLVGQPNDSDKSYHSTCEPLGDGVFAVDFFKVENTP